MSPGAHILSSAPAARSAPKTLLLCFSGLLLLGPLDPRSVGGSWCGTAARRLCNESAKETRVSWISSFWGHLLLRCPGLGTTMRVLPPGGDGGPWGALVVVQVRRSCDSAVSRCGPLRPAGLMTRPPEVSQSGLGQIDSPSRGRRSDAQNTGGPGARRPSWGSHGASPRGSRPGAWTCVLFAYSASFTHF